MCYKSIPRPPWEIRIYFLCLCGFMVSIMLIFILAVFDARRLFDNVRGRSIVLMIFISLIVFNSSGMA